MALADVPAPKKAGAEPRVRLDFLDGLRGLAALYVVLYHAGDTTGLSPLLTRAFAWTRYGTYSVAVFIVLSGYCLMLPVARSADGRLRGGVGAYLKRRARRILPPYYAALGIALLVIALLNLGEYQLLLSADEKRAFWAGPLISHLLMVHNLNEGWVYRINGPMWSVATEWQIYFLFPALLLPIWRKLGRAPLVAAAVLLGLAPHLLLPQNLSLDWARPWYVGLFAMGMAGASIGFGRDPRAPAWRDRVPWGLLAGVFFVVLVVVAATPIETFRRNFWQKELVIGLSASALIIYCARAAARQVRPLVLRILQSKPAVRLGHFSYSLYLIHIPIWLAMKPVYYSLGLPPLPSFLFRMLIFVPLAIVGAYLFHLAFERQFMTGFAAAEREPAAVVERKAPVPQAESIGRTVGPGAEEKAASLVAAPQSETG